LLLQTIVQGCCRHIEDPLPFFLQAAGAGWRLYVVMLMIEGAKTG
jgi:hypothetical protein